MPKQIRFVYGLNDYLDFGKYGIGKLKSKKIKEIIKDDPGYLVWVCKNIKSVKLTNNVLSKLK